MSCRASIQILLLRRQPRDHHTPVGDNCCTKAALCDRLADACCYDAESDRQALLLGLMIASVFWLHFGEGRTSLCAACIVREGDGVLASTVARFLCISCLPDRFPRLERARCHSCSAITCNDDASCQLLHAWLLRRDSICGDLM